MDTELIKELDEYLEMKGHDKDENLDLTDDWGETYTALFFKEKYEKAIELQELIDNIKCISHFPDAMKELKDVVNDYI